MSERLENALPWLEGLLFALLLAWLAASAVLVKTEYYDGYDSIVNASYFLGESKEYQSTRGPLMGLLLIPAEAIKRAQSMHPLEVAPHHITMAVLHSVYLLGAYFILIRVCGRRFASWLAYLCAVPVFLFFTYAPFISHDILPGIFLLTMVYLADRFMDSPGKRKLAGLILLGAGAALIKHTYALFWVFCFAGPVLLALIEKRKAAFGPALKLVLAAAGSGLLCVLVLGIALKGAMPDLGFFERVARQVEYLSGEAHDKSQISPLWIYLRNFPAFGVAAVLLILPGLVLSWRKSRMLRACVIVWVLAVIVMHLIGIRQVRYLAFVMPLTALLIVAPIQWLSRFRVGLPAVGLAWVSVFFTIYSPLREALHAFDVFHRTNPARAFLKPLDESGYLRTPIVINWGLLSFMHEREVPLVSDIYHGTFHLGSHHLFNLYGLKQGDIVRIESNQLGQLQDWPDGAVLMGTSAGPLLNPVSWQRVPPRNRDVLEQFIYLSEHLDVSPVSVVSGTMNGQNYAVAQMPELAALRPKILIPRWVSEEYPGGSQAVEMVMDNAWVLHGVKQLPLNKPVRIRYFKRVE